MSQHADIIALIVVLVIAAGMILYGDSRFGISVAIGAVVVFYFSRRRRSHR
jgi:hypothetical protein